MFFIKNILIILKMISRGMGKDGGAELLFQWFCPVQEGK